MIGRTNYLRCFFSFKKTLLVLACTHEKRANESWSNGYLSKVLIIFIKLSIFFSFVSECDLVWSFIFFSSNTFLLRSCKIGNCPQKHFFNKPQFLNKALLPKKELQKLFQSQSGSWPILLRLVKTWCQQLREWCEQFLYSLKMQMDINAQILHWRKTYSPVSVMPELCPLADSFPHDFISAHNNPSGPSPPGFWHVQTHPTWALYWSTQITLAYMPLVLF